MEDPLEGILTGDSSIYTYSFKEREGRESLKKFAEEEKKEMWEWGEDEMAKLGRRTQGGGGRGEHWDKFSWHNSRQFLSQLGFLQVRGARSQSDEQGDCERRENKVF